MGRGGSLVDDHLKADRDYYNAVSASEQSSPTAPFDGTTGMGFGTLANRPPTCTTNDLEEGGGVGYFATDDGPDGTLYRCSATDTWTVWYRPYAYPHPLVSGEPPPVLDGGAPPGTDGGRPSGTDGGRAGADAGGTTSSDDGCGCSAPGATPAGGAGGALALILRRGASRRAPSPPRESRARSQASQRLVLTSDREPVRASHPTIAPSRIPRKRAGARVDDRVTDRGRFR